MMKWMNFVKWMTLKGMLISVSVTTKMFFKWIQQTSYFHWNISGDRKTTKKCQIPKYELSFFFFNFLMKFLPALSYRFYVIMTFVRQLSFSGKVMKEEVLPCSTCFVRIMLCSLRVAFLLCLNLDENR